MSLVPYVPRLAFRLLGNATPIFHEARFEELDASVLLADISGFTALADKLARDYHDRGAERLQEVLNRCFGPLTQIVDAAGGEVLSFPGDAALAIWVGGNGTGTALADLARRSASCGLRLQAQLDRFPALHDVELRLRVAIGAGRSWAALVGGVDGRWETVLQGEATDQLSETLEEARPGEVVLSAAATALSGSAIAGERRGTHFVLAHVDERAVPPAVNLEPLDAAGSEHIARSFIPHSVMARIDAGQRAWLAEFRTVTVGFIRIVGIVTDDHVTLQRTMHLIQTVVSGLEGEINQIVADEKGLTAVIVFGVMQRAHEDDAARGVRAALAIRDGLRDFHVDARIGLASGRVFTGTRGGTTRVEFAILGTSVVLAARLAAASDGILCDEATRLACRKVIRFESLAAIPIKGRTERVGVWRPFSVRLDTERSGSGLVGRRAERALLDARLVELERRGRGGVVLLEGEPGIGKSALIEDLIKVAQTRAVRTLIGKCDSIERRTAYLAWRPIVAAVIGSDVLHDQHLLSERLIELLGAENGQWIPLLNAVLPITFPENEDTLSLGADSRARTARDLLIALLNSAATTIPLLVVLEDAHWMDAASWELAEQAVSRVVRLLLLISVRPHSDRSDPLDRLSMSTRSDATTLRLGRLDGGDMRDLICRRLDVDEIPEELAALVDQRAEGHPLFAGELAFALRDRGALVVREGICRIAPDGPSLAMQPFPAGVQGAVASRIDQLAPQEQLTLKVAAVLGRQFRFRELAEVHPLVQDVATLEKHLARIAVSGLLEVSPDAAGTFSFSHAVVQEVAYDLLPFNQRVELHRRTAEWLERAHVGHLDDLAPLLAHHWEQSETIDKAIEYLEKAGERALLRDSSDRDAEDFLTRLVRLAGSRPVEDDEPVVDVPTAGHLRERTIMLARWERLLAQALMRQGRHAEGEPHLERCLMLLGQQPPRRSLKIRIELVNGVVRRLALRPPPVQPRQRSAPVRHALLEIALAYEKLVEYKYLGRADVTGSVVATFRAIRVAELAGPSVELSRAYSFFANLAAMCRRTKRADYYSEQGRAIALDIGNKDALFRALTIGTLPAFIRGEWRHAAAAWEQAMVLATELRIIQEGLIFEYALAHVYLNQGQLNESLSRFRELRARAEHNDSLIPQLWATASMGDVALRQGNLNDAISWAESSLELADRSRTVDQNSRFVAHGVLASARLRTEGPDRARQHIAHAKAAADAGAKLSYAAQSGFIGVTEVLFSLVTRSGPDGPDSERQLRRWLRSLQLMAFCRPILEPWDLFFRAQWNVHRGHDRLAIRQLGRAMRRADQMSLAYESGCSRAALMNLLPRDDARRDQVFEEACDIFNRIGAVRALKETMARHARGKTEWGVGLLP